MSAYGRKQTLAGVFSPQIRPFGSFRASECLLSTQSGRFSSPAELASDVYRRGQDYDTDKRFANIADNAAGTAEGHSEKCGSRQRANKEPLVADLPPQVDTENDQHVAQCNGRYR